MFVYQHSDITDDTIKKIMQETDLWQQFVKTENFLNESKRDLCEF